MERCLADADGAGRGRLGGTGAGLSPGGGGGAGGDAAFVAASGEHPDDPWLAQAAGYVHAGHARWEEALRSWKVTRDRPEMPL